MVTFEYYLTLKLLDVVLIAGKNLFLAVSPPLELRDKALLTLNSLLHGLEYFLY